MIYQRIVVVYKDSEVQSIDNASICINYTPEMLLIRSGRTETVINKSRIKRIMCIKKEGE